MTHPIVNIFNKLIITLLISVLYACTPQIELDNSNTNTAEYPIISEDTAKPPHNQNEEFQKISIYDLSVEDLPSHLNLDYFTIYIPYNHNTDSKINRTISIYGQALTDDTPEILKNALTKKFSKIILYSEDTLIAQANSYNAKGFLLNDNKNGFELELVLDHSNTELKDRFITSIVFFISDDISFTKEIKNFQLVHYEELENSVKVIESPIAFKEALTLNKDASFNVVYTFLTANPNYNEDYTINIDLPLWLNEHITIESITAYEDYTLKDEVTSLLRDQMTPQQHQDLRVISLQVSYNKLSDSPIMLQPLIKLNITGEHQEIGVFEPLII